MVTTRVTSWLIIIYTLNWSTELLYWLLVNNIAIIYLVADKFEVFFMFIRFWSFTIIRFEILYLYTCTCMVVYTCTFHTVFTQPLILSQGYNYLLKIDTFHFQYIQIPQLRKRQKKNQKNDIHNKCDRYQSMLSLCNNEIIITLLC